MAVITLQIFKMSGEGTFGLLAVIGLRANTDARAADLLAAINSSAGLSAQVLDATRIAGFRHLQAAALMASNAWARKANVSRSPATEVLVYASAKRQIKEAISAVGVHPGSLLWAVIGVGRSDAATDLLERSASRFGTPDDSVLEMSGAKAREITDSFQIGGAEASIAERLTGSRLGAIQSLVLERVALSEFRR